MWTLLTQLSGGTPVTVGLFSDPNAATLWAVKHLPTLTMVAIELMLQDEHADVIREAELFTDSGSDTAVALSVN